jgi:uncharacterized phosphosugar-binding protein
LFVPGAREPEVELAGEWTRKAQALLQDLINREAPRISRAAEWCAHAIGAGGLVHLFGTGHSRIAVEEMFPRYGSYPGFNPMVELSMTFHTQVVGSNGQRQAMFIERVPGLAEQVLANYKFSRSDVMVVFSTSGVTAVPIEMAAGARARGLRVVAVTSVRSSRLSPSLAPDGTRLYEHADLVIDLGTPAGDAMVHLEGLDVPIGPGSTVAAVAVVNELKVQTARLLLAAGNLPPVITAASVVGPERSAHLFDAAYADHARRLARALCGEDVLTSPDDGASLGRISSASG